MLGIVEPQSMFGEVAAVLRFIPFVPVAPFVVTFKFSSCKGYGSLPHILRLPMTVRAGMLSFDPTPRLEPNTHRRAAYESRKSTKKEVELCYCVHMVRTMETVKIGIREFRDNLAGYLESGTPLAITRHGETLGFYIPAQKRDRKAEIAAMHAAAKQLDKMIASWGATEDELMDEYKEIRRATRAKKKLNAK